MEIEATYRADGLELDRPAKAPVPDLQECVHSLEHFQATSPLQKEMLPFLPPPSDGQHIWLHRDVLADLQSTVTSPRANIAGRARAMQDCYIEAEERRRLVFLLCQEMYKEVADIDSWRAPIFYPLHVWHPDVDQGSLREHWKHWDEERQLLHQGFQQDVSSNVWSVDWCYGAVKGLVRGGNPGVVAVFTLCGRGNEVFLAHCVLKPDSFVDVAPLLTMWQKLQAKCNAPQVQTSTTVVSEHLLASCRSVPTISHNPVPFFISAMIRLARGARWLLEMQTVCMLANAAQGSRGNLEKSGGLCCRYASLPSLPSSDW